MTTDHQSHYQCPRFFFDKHQEIKTSGRRGCESALFNKECVGTQIINLGVDLLYYTWSLCSSFYG